MTPGPDSDATLLALIQFAVSGEESTCRWGVACGPDLFAWGPLWDIWLCPGGLLSRVWLLFGNLALD